MSLQLCECVHDACTYKFGKGVFESVQAHCAQPLADLNPLSPSCEHASVLDRQRAVAGWLASDTIAKTQDDHSSGSNISHIHEHLERLELLVFFLGARNSSKYSQNSWPLLMCWQSCVYTCVQTVRRSTM